MQLKLGTARPISEAAVSVLLFLGFPVVLGVVSSAVMRAVGLSRAQAAVRAGAVAAFSLIAGAVFAYDQLVYSVSEGGPEYYAFSPYMRYRRAVDGSGWALVLVAYQLAPAVLLTAAFTGERKLRRRWLRYLLLFVAVASMPLALIPPAALPRSEYGKDPVLHVAGPASVPRPGATQFVETCFLYGVERIGVDAPDFGAATARLCLYLANTRDARQLAGVDYEEGSPTIYDIANELNADGIKPFEKPQKIGIDGLQLRDARWMPA